ncbi:hypothetical protein AAFF_G00180350 [Aldrovandia affinis]|uniref:Uncharacterized protein n=1 Tax=Aldrovandia affinis TaxID=143900 RepID=A0AAD7WVY2_9TELE|nr:hypothetical protein AAFF_G00180350 [Aldrovandia affinis]
MVLTTFGSPSISNNVLPVGSIADAIGTDGEERPQGPQEGWTCRVIWDSSDSTNRSGLQWRAGKRMSVLVRKSTLWAKITTSAV